MNSAPCVRLNHLNTFGLWTAVVSKMWRRVFFALLPIFGKLFFYVMETIFWECKEHVIYELKEINMQYAYRHCSGVVPTIFKTGMCKRL